jgi:hypothetical protein
MPHPPRCGDPHNAIELRILFYSIEYVAKKWDTFFQFILVQLYQLIFTSQCDSYFWCFYKRFTLIFIDLRKQLHESRFWTCFL